MVKNPPCQQYEGPQIEYQRNGQTFCQNKIIYGTLREKDTYLYSILKHLIYVGMDTVIVIKTYKNLNQSQKNSKTNVFDKCLQLNHSKLKIIRSQTLMFRSKN